MIVASRRQEEEDQDLGKSCIYNVIKVTLESVFLCLGLSSSQPSRYTSTRLRDTPDPQPHPFPTHQTATAHRPSTRPSTLPPRTAHLAVHQRHRHSNCRPGPLVRCSRACFPRQFYGVQIECAEGRISEHTQASQIEFYGVQIE